MKDIVYITAKKYENQGLTLGELLFFAIEGFEKAIRRLPLTMKKEKRDSLISWWIRQEILSGIYKNRKI